MSYTNLVLYQPKETFDKIHSYQEARDQFPLAFVSIDHCAHELNLLQFELNVKTLELSF